MRHLVWVHDEQYHDTLCKPQDWNYCRYCGAAITDRYNVPVCDECYPEYRRYEKLTYLRTENWGLAGPVPHFDPQTGIKGPETFQSEGWKYLDTTDGYQHVRDFVQLAI